MAVVSGTVHSVETIRANALDPHQVAHVLFTVSGTYAQADNGILSGVPTLIQNSRRNGKTVTIRDAMLYQPARKSADPSLLMGLKTVAISTNDITFEITETATVNTVEYTTEHADATAVPAQSTPFGLAVAFSEA
jgi:hypothetical protein